MSLKYILFDLDGTVTDSQEGIVKCVEYVLEKMGRAIPEKKKLLEFIGPPLVESFQTITGMSAKDGERATEIYRERYNVTGLFENKLYDGMDTLLATLQKEGYHLAIATSKPQVPTEKILQHFDLTKYFDAIVGASVDHTRATKQAVIEEALRQLGVSSDEDKKSTLMVGDRKFDILGAKGCNIASLGVYYGFAPENELEENGADYIVQNVSDILPLVHNI